MLGASSSEALVITNLYDVIPHKTSQTVLKLLPDIGNYSAIYKEGIIFLDDFVSTKDISTARIINLLGLGVR
jgi:hypothetical protein